MDPLKMADTQMSETGMRQGPFAKKNINIKIKIKFSSANDGDD